MLQHTECKSPVTAGIYKITCTANGKCYIGSAINPEHRWNGGGTSHVKMARRGQHHSEHFQRAWNKYGEQVFSFEIIEKVADPSDLIAREQFWMDHHQSYERDKGFNMQPRAASSLGYKHSEAFCKAISERQKGRKAKQSTRDKMSTSRQGSKQWNAKLDEPTLISVFQRLMSGESQADIARELKITPSAINQAVNSNSWTHVPTPVGLKIGYATGEKHGMAKLDWPTVRAIKADLANGCQVKAVASKHGISRQSVTDIKFNRTWREPA